MNDRAAGFGDSEVQELDHAGLVEHEVLRAHVPVDETEQRAQLVLELMGDMQSVACLGNDLGGDGVWHRLVVLDSAVGERPDG